MSTTIVLCIGGTAWRLGVLASRANGNDVSIYTLQNQGRVHVRWHCVVLVLQGTVVGRHPLT